ncbi:MAG TPA: N-acetylmuramic acid 6-phosphate etherase [Jatrophihabitans sp.]|nr:N-acetylmuramic acid 6-phosphate etherase [Jatrophihabitans sp.]
MVNLDLLPTEQIVALLLDAERRVVPAAEAAGSRIAAAAELLAARLAAGGRVVFAGAGTSGRIAVAEAAELPGTFGLDRSAVHSRVAGGAASRDVDEDDLSHARHDLDELALTAADVLVAVAASGSTPYTLEVAQAARAVGCAVIAVTNMPGSRLAALADVAIEIDVGPEVLRGSTRLSAGTAQKVALNALTTAAMVRLGRVHGDLMIDVEPANAKLRERAAAIVAEIAGCDQSTAATALSACSGSARAAVLHVVLQLDPAAALARAARFASLREALAPPPVSEA